jgi:hypothetical protein
LQATLLVARNAVKIVIVARRIALAVEHHLETSALRLLEHAPLREYRRSPERFILMPGDVGRSRKDIFSARIHEMRRRAGALDCCVHELPFVDSLARICRRDRFDVLPTVLRCQHLRHQADD